MLSFIDVIPSKENVSRSESLNILCGVANDSGEINAKISLWARCSKQWRALITEESFISDHEHKHLYYTITPDMLSEEYWGEEVEEIELCVSDREPKDSTRGVIVFIN